MEKLIKIVTKVVKVLVENGYTFTSDDQPAADDHNYLEIGGQEIVVGGDNEREEWSVNLENVKKGDVAITHEELERLTSLGLKRESVKVPRSDIVVHNWKPMKNILVVQCKDSIEFSQH